MSKYNILIIDRTVMLLKSVSPASIFLTLFDNCIL